MSSTLVRSNSVDVLSNPQRRLLNSSSSSVLISPLLVFSLSQFFSQRTSVLLPTVATAFLEQKRSIHLSKGIQANVDPLDMDNASDRPKGVPVPKTRAVEATATATSTITGAAHPYTAVSWATLGQVLRRNSGGSGGSSVFHQISSGQDSPKILENMSPVGPLQISPPCHPLSSVVMTPHVEGAVNCSPQGAEQKKKKNALLHYSSAYNPLADFPGADSYAHYVSSRTANSAPATLRSSASSDPTLMEAKPVTPPSKSSFFAPVVPTEPSSTTTATMQDNFECVHPLSMEHEMMAGVSDHPNNQNHNKPEENVKGTFQSSSAPLALGTFNCFNAGWSQEIQEVRERIMEGRAELETYTLMYQQRQENLRLVLEECNHLKKERLVLEERIGTLETEYKRAKGTAATLSEGGECCLTRETRAGSLMDATMIITASTLSLSNSIPRLAVSALTAASSSTTLMGPPHFWSLHPPPSDVKPLPSSKFCSLCQKSDALAEKRGQLRRMDKELDLIQRKAQKCTSYLSHAQRTYLDPVNEHLIKDQAILAQLLMGSKRHSEGDLLTGVTGTHSKQVLGYRQSLSGHPNL